MNKTEDVRGTYTIQYKCNNCNGQGQKDFFKGEFVPDKFMCPNCECETAKQHIPITTSLNWDRILENNSRTVYTDITQIPEYPYPHFKIHY